MLLLITLLYSTSIAHGEAISLPELEVRGSAESSPDKTDLSFGQGSALNGAAWSRGGEEIENVLPAIPGLSFSAAGGPGQPRALFLRGAKAEHTLVLVDGMPVNDPLSPARGFDFGLVPAAEVERIEVLKGPQSVLYGSDALGGVVKIFTRGEEARPRIFLEGGAFSTYRARASAAGIQAGFLKTRGFSAADANDGNAEPDGHAAGNIGFNRAFAIGGRSTLRAQAFYAASKTDTDRAGGPGGDSFGTFTKNQQGAARAELTTRLKNKWSQSVSASLFRRTRFDTTQGEDFYRGLLLRADAEIRREDENGEPRFGLNYTQESGNSNQLKGRGLFHSGAIYAQNEKSLGAAKVVAGARADLHSLYGAAFTYRLGGGLWLVPDSLALRAHYATGFKGPSLYQTYSIYGSSGLRPERSRGGELGLLWQGSKGAAELAIFSNHFSELVDFAPTPVPGRFYNIGRVATRGLELSGTVPIGKISLQNAFTWLAAVDETSGARLLRRPSLTNNLKLSYEQKHFGLAADFRFNGHRFDLDPVNFARVRMPGFFTVAANAQYRLEPGRKLLVRAENLLNRRYQETSGFGTAPLSLYLGAEIEL